MNELNNRFPIFPSVIDIIHLVLASELFSQEQKSQF